MISNAPILEYIAEVTGKPVVAILNDTENKWYFYSVDSFSPANPSNHIHDSSLSGRDLSSMLNSMTGFAHGHDVATDNAIINKVNEIIVSKITFNGLRWIKFNK
jgi:hypothetical protein